MSLSELAAMACLSPSQFHRIFKNETRRTPFKFIEEIRMQRAYDSLIHENRSVYELAEGLGYNDYETFSRAFKKHFLLSPDDLKSIANNIKDSLSAGQQGEFYITAFKGGGSDEEIALQLRQTMQMHNISTEDLKQAHFFKIAPKDHSGLSALQLVKNKFEITSGKKIWELLLNKK